MCLRPSSPCSGDSGCTEMSTTSGMLARRNRPVPMNVPLVPSAATKCVMRPAVSARISGPVVSKCARQLNVVVVLVRVEVQLWGGGIAAPGLDDRAVRAVHRIGEHQLGAVGGQDPLAFGAGARRQAQRHRKPQRGADHRVGNPGVARRGVEQSLAGTERARADALEDHVAGGAVLDRAARIARFELAVQLEAGHVALDRVSRTSGVLPIAFTRVESMGEPFQLMANPPRCTTGV